MTQALKTQAIKTIASNIFTDSQRYKKEQFCQYFINLVKENLPLADFATKLILYPLNHKDEYFQTWSRDPLQIQSTLFGYAIDNRCIDAITLFHKNMNPLNFANVYMNTEKLKQLLISENSNLLLDIAKMDQINPVSIPEMLFRLKSGKLFEELFEIWVKRFKGYIKLAKDKSLNYNMILVRVIYNYVTSMSSDGNLEFVQRMLNFWDKNEDSSEPLDALTSFLTDNSINNEVKKIIRENIPNLSQNNRKM